MAKRFTKEELDAAFWKRVQGSMAMEGYHVADEQIATALERYERSGRGQKLEKLVAKAKREKRPLRDVMREARAKGEWPPSEI